MYGPAWLFDTPCACAYTDTRTRKLMRMRTHTHALRVDVECASVLRNATLRNTGPGPFKSSMILHKPSGPKIKMSCLIQCAIVNTLHWIH